MIKILTLSFLFITSILMAQAPQVVDVFPTNQTVTAAANGTISVTFDTPLDLSTVAYGNFKVFGRWSGPAELVFSMSNDDKTVEMSLFEPLMKGEWVTVTLTKSIKSATGEGMAHSYVWNFWVATDEIVSEVEFTLIKTIELREAGEGLIQAYGAYAGDLNNDGFSDLTVVNETSDDLRILLNDGAGDYSDFEIVTLGNGTTPSPNEGADFDNDGEIDLAVCTAHDDDLRVLFGDGNGTLGNMENYTTGTNARGLAIIELDGDGNDDIVIANRGSSNLTLFQNDGFGAFESSTLDSPGSGESGLVVTDFNNDGIQDLIIGMYSSDEIVVMLGDTEMGFTTSAQIGVNGQPWMLAAGDLNGDGYADVVSANSTTDNVAVLLNDGAGGLMSPSYLTESGASFPLAIDLGDLDGDGDLDMVTSYYSTANYLVFFNDGSGGFNVGPSLDAGSHASCAILHDRDNDGDLDISGTDEGDDVLLLFDTQAGALAADDFKPSLINTLTPNPFQNSLSIEVSETCLDCEISIYNVLGILIKTIPVNQQSLISWDGTNDSGVVVDSGIYSIRIGGEGVFETLLVVKGR